MKFFKDISAKFLIFTFILILLGCYGTKHLSVDHLYYAYNSETKTVAFFTDIRLYRPAKGLLAFPDGGLPKDLYRNFSLYIYEFEKDELTKIYDFDRIIRSCWNPKVYFIGDDLAFKMVPYLGLGWDHVIKRHDNDIAIKEKWDRQFLFKYEDMKVIETDEFDEDAPLTAISVPDEIRKRINEYPYARWLDLDKISPVNLKQRINEIINLGGCYRYRDAIIELVGEKLTNSEIQEIIDKIEKKQDFPEFRRRKYLIPRVKKETMEKLRSVMR